MGIEYVIAGAVRHWARRILVWLLAGACLFSAYRFGCSDAGAQTRQTIDDVAAIEARLAVARQAVARANQLDRPILEPQVIATEQALFQYKQLASQGGARKKAATPLWVAGGIILGDDVTGIGVADDPLLLVVALGLAATYIITTAPPGQTQLDEAWGKVLYNAVATADNALTLAVRRAVVDVTTPIATRMALQAMRQKNFVQLAAEASWRNEPKVRDLSHQNASDATTTTTGRPVTGRKIRTVSADALKPGTVTGGVVEDSARYLYATLGMIGKTWESRCRWRPEWADLSLPGGLTPGDAMTCDLQYETASDACDALLKEQRWQCYAAALMRLGTCCRRGLR